MCFLVPSLMLDTQVPGAAAASRLDCPTCQHPRMCTTNCHTRRSLMSSARTLQHRTSFPGPEYLPSASIKIGWTPCREVGGQRLGPRRAEQVSKSIKQNHLMSYSQVGMLGATSCRFHISTDRKTWLTLRRWEDHVVSRSLGLAQSPKPECHL